MRDIPGIKSIGTVTLNAAAINLPLSTWVQLLATVPKAAIAVEFFNSTGATLALSQGVAGKEAVGLLPYTILQGGSSVIISIEISSGKPLTVQALDLGSVSGALVLNLFG